MNEDAAPTTPQSARISVRAPHRGGRKRYLLAAFFLLLAMIAGGVIGAGATIVFFDKRRPRPPTPEKVGDDLTKHMVEVLGLNDAEAAALRSAIVRRMKRVKEIRENSWKEIREEFSLLSGEAEDIVGSERYRIWEVERDKRLGERKHLREKERHGRRRREQPADEAAPSAPPPSPRSGD